MNQDIYQILINKENEIPEDLLNKIDLVKIINTKQKEILIEKETKKQYEKLKDYIKEKEGITIGIAYAYRTAQEQIEIYENFIKIYGIEYAKAIVAPVNHSEHQTGLAIDIEIYIEGKGFISNNKNIDLLTPIFEKSIHNYLHEFGFILRYPKGKEEITKVPFEPWHIRYVGDKLAKEIYDENITLEEYLN